MSAEEAYGEVNIALNAKIDSIVEGLYESSGRPEKPDEAFLKSCCSAIAPKLGPMSELSFPRSNDIQCISTKSHLSILPRDTLDQQCLLNQKTKQDQTKCRSVLLGIYSYKNNILGSHK